MKKYKVHTAFNADQTLLLPGDIIYAMQQGFAGHYRVWREDKTFCGSAAWTIPSFATEIKD